MTLPLQGITRRPLGRPCTRLGSALLKQECCQGPCIRCRALRDSSTPLTRQQRQRRHQSPSTRHRPFGRPCAQPWNALQVHRLSTRRALARSRLLQQQERCCWGPSTGSTPLRGSRPQLQSFVGRQGRCLGSSMAPRQRQQTLLRVWAPPMLPHLRHPLCHPPLHLLVAGWQQQLGRLPGSSASQHLRNSLEHCPSSRFLMSQPKLGNTGTVCPTSAALRPQVLGRLLQLRLQSSSRRQALRGALGRPSRSPRRSMPGIARFPSLHRLRD